MERDVFTHFLTPFSPYFNSHAHVERDMQADTFHDDLVNFNSHAHVERDMQADTFHDDLVNFNSHAHVERDQLFLFYTG